MARNRPRAPITSPAAATVFSTVLTRGPVTRVDVARRTGLSSAAVTKAARPFIEAGYMAEVAAEERTVPGAGRPASPLDIRAEREFFVGVKITGDDLIGVVTDLRAQVHNAQRHPLQSRAVDSVVAAIVNLVRALLAESQEFLERAHCLGVAVSGDVDRASGQVRYSPFLGWHDVPLAELLEEATGLMTTVENDVKALTIAEQWFGEGIGASSFALVTVGAGIGCGLVANGALVTGAFGVAGEIGHVPVADGGPPCHCGGVGCVEAIASTHAIVAQARLAVGEPELSMDQAVARARSGEETVRRVFAQAGHAIGLGLAAVANLFGPERIVVSGEGLAVYDLFDQQIQESFARQAFGSAARCGLAIRALPFEEWARGAAAVAVQTMFAPESTRSRQHAGHLNT
ncbi:ROK family protein [Streptomyces sp. HUAS TT20]|uniref:ROK family protein n=1 Tax=Streptomyces sp. HUAS TT20 TaxID=3447509 RepID=UPI0021D97CE2|nr:ROK family protein [Streptomyces sp. HUAS 15-9]UXY32888.1 ROK family protein [Streptomyces sp. HUAS 15-9]